MLEKKESNWLNRQVKREAKTDRLTISERGGEVIAAIVLMAVLLFFVAHQMWSTGFFTSEFGSAEAFMVYAPISIGLVLSLSRVILGRKNILRPFGSLLSIFIAISSVWLLVVFPFAFSELANVVPGFLQFLLSWVSDSVGQILLVIAIVGAAVFTVYNAVLYVFVRQELSKPI